MLSVLDVVLAGAKTSWNDFEDDNEKICYILYAADQEIGFSTKSI